ncbi:DnaJ domain-containing protein [Chenggangzhangella methanolivorans]|uniref:DnaJ domain-containing protein n=1 Tax=Chenggangzhangella methanolivorans TaxID=1437009 RepID=A0A9E6UP76_9HYPH|nr:DnaJ domain-containing protein [Chenggangzhangella methanolivorans]
MIWIVFGAMAVATFLAVSQILVEADPERARKQIRTASVLTWVAGLALCLFGKALFGLPLMALGALGAFFVPKRRSRSRVSEGQRRGGPAGRRPDFQAHADPGAGEVGPDMRSGVVTEQQAYQILGLQPGATSEEIARAHRALMKKLHPDQGGSTELAARVNAAKDVLAKRRHG